MLRSQPIRQLLRLCNRFGYKYRALRRQRLLRNRIVLRLRLHLSGNIFRQRFIAGNQNGERLGIMLRLRHQVGGDARGDLRSRW